MNTPEQHLFQILQLLIHGKDPLAAAQAKEASKVLDKVASLTAEVAQLREDKESLSTSIDNLNAMLHHANGFRLIEVLLVPHGGWHNDTIVTVEVKTP